MSKLSMQARLALSALASCVILSGCGGGDASPPASALTAQTITFAGPGNQSLGTTPPPLVATATSGLPVTITSTTAPVCTVSGTTLTLVSAGTCTLDASQAGNASTAAAKDVVVSFTVAVALPSQTINFTSPGNQVLGTTPPPLSATASSGLPVTITSKTPGVCTVSGTTLTLVGGGTCTLAADQAGNANYAPAVEQTVAFTVSGGTISTLTFSSGFAANNLTVEGGAFGGYSGSNLDNYGCGGAPSATSCGSGGSFVPTVTAPNSGFYYYYQTNTPASGEYVGVYLQAPGLTTGISATGNTPGIQLTGQTTMSFNFGENPEWFASATKNFGVILTLGKLYTVGGNACNIKLLKVVTPTAAANSNYTLNLNSFAVTQNCGVAGLTATQALAASPISQIDFQGDGGPPALSDGTLTTGANLSVANTASPPVYPTTLVVNGPITFQGSTSLQSQTISFTSPGNQTLGTAPLALTPTASSGLAVTISSTTPSVCTVTGSTVTLVAAGACSLTASQAGNATYAAATPVTVSFTVSSGSSALTFSSGFAANNLTVEGGAFGGYSGSNLDNYGCGGAPSATSCGSGGSFVPTVTAPNSGFYYYYQTNTPASGEYVGVYLQAPGLTTGISATGNTPGIQLTGQTTMSFNFGENPEWFASATKNFGVILTLGKLYTVGGNACNIKLLKVVTPTAAANSNYTLNLNSFAVTQNCGVAGLTATQALAASPISQIDFQGDGGPPALSDGTLSTGANLSVANTASPPVYPTTLVVNGPISFQ